jgi:hypothetical protein
MEIATLKVKSRNLPVLTFGHSDLNIFRYRHPFDANLIFLDSWLKDLSMYKSSSKKDPILGRYNFSKMKNEFCQQIGFVKKRVQITSRSIQTDIQVFISSI